MISKRSCYFAGHSDGTDVSDLLRLLLHGHFGGFQRMWMAGLAAVATALAAPAVLPSAVLPPTLLPSPGDDPLAIAAGTDPLIARLGETEPGFAARAAAAAQHLPALLARAADVDAARAQSTVASSPLLPRLSLEAVGSQSLSRDFGGRSTFAERLVPLGRADAILAAEQTLFDFGATMARARAGTAGTEAARAELALAREQAALLLVQAWAGVSGSRMEALAAADHRRRIEALAADASQRFERGLDSGAALAQARAHAAEAAVSDSMAQRRLAEAEALFLSVYGEAPGALLWPQIAPTPPAGDAEGPRVAAARARLRAASALAHATQRERLPQVSTRLSGALYNVLGTGFPDHDVRGQVVIRQNFSLGGAELGRAREARARADAAAQELARAQAEDARDRSVAASDVRLLGEALASARLRYLESRRSRDMVDIQTKRLRAALPELLRVEQELANAAAGLVRAHQDHLLARARLLAQHGRLADQLQLEPIT